MRRVVIALLIVAIGVAFARTKYSSPGSKIFNVVPIKINDLWLWNSNFGEFGQLDNPEGPGGEWPGGSGHMYNFGSGLWFGCIDANGDTLVSVGYNPNTGSGEMVPGLIEMGSAAQTDPEVRVYAYPGDWPPPLTLFPMAPQKNFSLADQWMCFNDADPAFHVANDTKPIGLEFYMSVYGWNYESNKDIIFFRVSIKNLSGDSIKDAFLGICDDPDIGDAGDDIVRCFVDTTFWDPDAGDSVHVDNVGYDYDYDGAEPGWDSVGCIAFDYLQSPYALYDGIDNDWEKDTVYHLPPTDSLWDLEEADSALFTAKVTDPTLWDGDGDGVMDWRDPSMIEQFGMSAFMRFTLEIDPSFDYQRYQVMAGYDYRTGEYKGYMNDDNSPDDKRFIQCTGPFSMANEDSVVVVFAVICAGFSHPGGSGADSLHLVRRDAVAQFIFDMNWLLPGPPPAPSVTAIPGDHMVTLTWDDMPEHTPDPYYEIASNPASSAYDSFYVQYDFQGYKVYKSLTGQSTDWILLDQCDLADTVDTATLIDTATPESVRTIPLNTGLYHSYVDTMPRNGFTYYYAVTAYDFNAVTLEGSLKRQFSLECGKSAIAVSPRREAANYIPPTCSIATVNVPDNPATNIDIKIPVPMEVNTNTFVLKFDKPTCDTMANSYIPVYWYTLTKNGQEVVPKTGMELDFGDSIKIGFAIDDGIELSFKTGTNEFFNEEAFKTFEVVSGSYPVESLTPYRTLSIHRNRWAFSGADYKVEWQSTGSGMTAKVTDLNTNEEIPYKVFNPQHETLKQDAWSWCFLDRTSSAGVPSQYLQDSVQAYFHITGGFFAFLPSRNPLPAALFPQDGDEWIIYSKKTKVVPYDCEWQIYTYPAQFLKDTTLTLNVKVVPNPYVVENEWQQTVFQRKLKFINLPDKCKIRIYTVAGDLIRTINHDKTYQQPNDAGGDEWWDVLTTNDQLPASGVYLFHIDSDVGEQVGKFVVIIGGGKQ